MSVAVLSAGGEGAWEQTWVAAFAAGTHGVRIARRCVDVVDLLAAAAAGQGRLALVDAGLRRLDADAIDRLRAAQVIPIGVMPRGDAEAEDRLRAAGVTHLVPADADPAVAASVIVDALRSSAEGDDIRAARTFGDPSTSMAMPPGAAAPPPPGDPVRTGSLVAVWGPTGAPGRTTVAVGLADELARRGDPTLLVDADVYGATIAATLGLLDESPGLAAACRQAGNRRLTPAALAALSWQLSPQLRLLTGLPLAQRWPELRPAGVEAVLDTARSLADFVVIDCGFCLETDEELSFDTLAPRRNGATLAVLAAADLVLVVGAADPIGMQRLVRGLAELRDLGIERSVWVVLNRVRRGAVPGNPHVELTAALERFAGRSAAALLPADQDSIDAALATGRTLAETRPNSALRRALLDLAAAVAGLQTPAGQRAR
jgi:MinD-like ATPase involved in chromosome partitioning or flagellar assembly